MILSESCQDGYKPVIFAEIPDTFNQMTQCVFQGDIVDSGDHINVGINIRDIEPEDTGDAHEQW